MTPPTLTAAQRLDILTYSHGQGSDPPGLADKVSDAVAAVLENTEKFDNCGRPRSTNAPTTSGVIASENALGVRDAEDVGIPIDDK